MPEEGGSGSRVSIHARATACDGEILAGEPAADDASLGNKASGSELVTGHLRYVGEQGHVGESVCEDTTRGGVDLHRGDNLDARTGEREVESADAGEQRDGSETHRRPTFGPHVGHARHP